MTCLHSGLVAQSVRATVINSVDCGFKPHLAQRFLCPSVGPIPKLGLMLRGDKLGISKPIPHWPCSSIGRAIMMI